MKGFSKDLKVSGDNTCVCEMLCIWGKLVLLWSVWVKKLWKLMEMKPLKWEILDTEIILVPDALLKQQCIET